MKQGTICLVNFPFTDRSGSKVRPVLVISADRFNRGEDVVVVPLSSKPNPGDPMSIFIDAGDPAFPLTGLKQPSAVKWAKPTVVAKTVLARRLGRLDDPLLTTTLQNLAGMFDRSR